MSEKSYSEMFGCQVEHPSKFFVTRTRVFDARPIIFLFVEVGQTPRLLCVRLPAYAAAPSIYLGMITHFVRLLRNLNRPRPKWRASLVAIIAKAMLTSAVREEGG
jgi:hypothetical protein